MIARSAEQADETAWPPAGRVIRRMSAERVTAVAESNGGGDNG